MSSQDSSSLTNTDVDPTASESSVGSDGDDSSSGPKPITIALPVLAGLAALAAVVYLLWRRRATRQREEYKETSSMHSAQGFGAAHHGDHSPLPPSRPPRPSRSFNGSSSNPKQSNLSSFPLFPKQNQSFAPYPPPPIPSTRSRGSDLSRQPSAASLIDPRSSVAREATGSNVPSSLGRFHSGVPKTVSAARSDLATMHDGEPAGDMDELKGAQQVRFAPSMRAPTSVTGTSSRYPATEIAGSEDFEAASSRWD